MKQRFALSFSLLVTLFVCTLHAADAPSYLFYPSTPAEVMSALPDAIASDAIHLTAPAKSSVIQILQPVQKNYLLMPHDERIEAFADKDFRQKLVSSGAFPQVVTLSWSADGLQGKDMVVYVSESSDFKPSVAVSLPFAANGHLPLHNLKIATTYYWKVMVANETALLTSAAGTFTTEDIAPRLLRIDDVPNVRDLGGRIGLNGRRVRQGMVYRSAGINNNATNTYLPPEQAAEKCPELKPYLTSITALEKEYRQGVDDAMPPLHYVDCTLNRTWTVFIPSPDSNIIDFYSAAACTDVPTSFLDVNGQSMTADENGRLDLGIPEEDKTAILFQTFQSPEDGWLQISCGGDWFWNIAVNSRFFADHYFCGNLAYPVKTENHVLDVPVKKGQNIIAVMLKSGSHGWAWYCDAVAERRSHKDVCQNRLAIIKTQNQKTFTVIGESFPGASRLKEGMADYMSKTLGIRSDIDLRSARECACMTGSPIGPSVTWFHISSSSYDGMSSSFGKKAFTDVFKVFLNAENYPIVFHCIAGQDRTGAVAFIINGLLGVSEEELYLDWEATGFRNGSNSFNHKRLFNNLVNVFTALPGQTLNEQIESYVLSLGFSKEDIETLRNIMLEE